MVFFFQQTEMQNFLVEARKIYEESAQTIKKLKKEITPLGQWPSLDYDVIAYNLIGIFKERNMYSDLKIKSFTAEAEEIERMLDACHISEFEHEIHEDLEYYASESEDELHEEL